MSDGKPCATYLLPNNCAPAQILDADWFCRTRHPSGVSLVEHAEHIDDAIGQKLMSVAVRFAAIRQIRHLPRLFRQNSPSRPVKFR